MNINTATLVGRVGKDPEVRTFPSGDQIATLSLATSERYKDKSGEKHELTQWHNLVVRGGLVDVVKSYVHKGDELGIVGSIRYREYQDKDGNNKRITEIMVKELSLASKSSGKSGAPDNTEEYAEADPF